jgi:hypothetical protein
MISVHFLLPRAVAYRALDLTERQQEGIEKAYMTMRRARLKKGQDY